MVNSQQDSVELELRRLGPRDLGGGRFGPGTTAKMSLRYRHSLPVHVCVCMCVVCWVSCTCMHNSMADSIVLTDTISSIEGTAQWWLVTRWQQSSRYENNAASYGYFLAIIILAKTLYTSSRLLGSPSDAVFLQRHRASLPADSESVGLSEVDAGVEAKGFYP